MVELIPFTQDEKGRKLINLRDLHAFLGVKTVFRNWIKRRIENYKFKEGRDYTRPKMDAPNDWEYFGTISMAKQLTMLENNEKGQQAREYFIEIEEAFTDVKNQLKSGTTAEALLENIHSLETAVMLIVAQEGRIKELEAYVQKDKEEKTRFLEENNKEPVPSVPAPEATKRKLVWSGVRKYASRHGIDYAIMWKKFYEQFGLAASLNVPIDGGLEYIEKKGRMEEAYAFMHKHYSN